MQEDNPQGSHGSRFHEMDSEMAEEAQLKYRDEVSDSCGDCVLDGDCEDGHDCTRKQYQKSILGKQFPTRQFGDRLGFASHRARRQIYGRCFVALIGFQHKQTPRFKSSYS